MSQRECAGLNWPPLAIPAEEPVSISPDAVSRAGCSERASPAALGKSRSECLESFDGSPQLFRKSRTTGVGHPANCAVSFGFAIP